MDTDTTLITNWRANPNVNNPMINVGKCGCYNYNDDEEEEN